MKVEPREIAAAPVSHIVAAEPVRTSVIGAGRPVSVRPPAAVISRPVVAVRTPPPPPRPIEQRQAQAGGHLNQQILVRPAGPVQPAQMSQNTHTPPVEKSFKPLGQPSSPNNNTSVNTNNQVKPMLRPQPRVYEQQGTPEPENRNMQANENRNVPPQENRNTQPANQGFRPPEKEQRPVPQETHPLVRPTPPVQERNPQQEQQQAEKFNQWQQQRPAQPPAQRPQPQPSRPEPSRQEKPKGR
jgi:hypothetical protein